MRRSKRLQSTKTKELEDEQQTAHSNKKRKYTKPESTQAHEDDQLESKQENINDVCRKSERSKAKGIIEIKEKNTKVTAKNTKACSKASAIRSGKVAVAHDNSEDENDLISSDEIDSESDKKQANKKKTQGKRPVKQLAVAKRITVPNEKIPAKEPTGKKASLKAGSKRKQCQAESDCGEGNQLNDNKISTSGKSKQSKVHQVVSICDPSSLVTAKIDSFEISKEFDRGQTSCENDSDEMESVDDNAGNSNSQGDSGIGERSSQIQSPVNDSSDIKKILMTCESRLSMNQMAPDYTDLENSGTDQDDWEEVAEHTDHHKVTGHVQFTLQGPDIMKKKQKKKFDVKDWFRLLLNRYKRKTQMDVHKVHLLCLVADGFRKNKMCNNMLVQSTLLTQVPSKFHLNHVDDWDMEHLHGIVGSFREMFTYSVSCDSQPVKVDLSVEQVCERISSRSASSDLEYVQLFVATLRALGLQVRLVLTLLPTTHKATDLKAKKSSKKTKTEFSEPGTSKTKTEHSEPGTSKQSSGHNKRTSGHHNIKEDEPDVPQKKRKESGKNDGRTKAGGKTDKDSSNSGEARKQTRLKSRAGNKQDVEDTADDEEEETDAVKKPQRRRTKVVYKETSDEDQDDDKRQTVKKSKTKAKLAKGGGSRDSSDDFENPPPKLRRGSSQGRSSGRKSAGKVKILSTDSSENKDITEKKKGTDAWVEVYLDIDNRWVCVDCITGCVDKPEKMEELCTDPTYIIAYNNEHHIKDVTRRYVSHWLKNHQPVDSDWWEETLKPYSSKSDQLEECQLSALHANKPFPTSVAQFKKHPLYALRRHLLKFEALYPADVTPVGFIKGEAIYPRSCVQLLHTRENWLKEARSVKLGEEPYKYVKALPKYRRGQKQLSADGTEQMAQLFGHWQTEEYVSPPVIEGKIPRNGYGNVELFKMSMLPAGSVYIKLAGLNKVARKLGIDCAPAMLGWEHHQGRATPILEGWVVPQESREVLETAWEEEQEIQQQREYEKREKRVTDNWKKLIKGLLAREKIKRKYGLTKQELTALQAPEIQEPQTSKGKGKQKKKTSTPAVKPEASWPTNRGKDLKESAGDLFPFEVEQM